MINPDSQPNYNLAITPSVAGKEIIQTDKSIFDDLGRDLSNASPKEQIDQLTRGLAAIQDRIAMLPKARNRVQISIEMEKICSELEKIGPAAINNCLKELNNLKSRYTPLLLHGEGQQDFKGELEAKQKVLLSSLITAYKMFSAIRETVSGPNANLPFIKNDLELVHSKLSDAMLQPSSSPSASVEFPILKPSMLTTARLILTDSYARGKIGQAVSTLVKGVAVAAKNAFVRHVLRDKTAEKPSVTMNKATTVMTNNIAALSTFLAGLVFGKDLLAGSRNVVRTSDTKSAKDIAMTTTLKTKIARAKEDQQMLASRIEIPEIPLNKVVHIRDGICTGLSLELSLRVLRNGEKGYLHFAEQMAKGAPPEAHANQACYEAMEGMSMTTQILEDLMTEHQAHALDAKNGEGIYKANYDNVKNCYHAIIHNANNENAFNDSPLAEAVQKVDKNLFKKSKGGEYYITDIQKFREEVLNHLPNDNPEARKLAENELNWLVGNLEVRFVLNYVTKQIDQPFKTGTGGDLEAAKENPSIEAILSFVSNPDIRKNLAHMVKLKDDFIQLQTIARARGASLEPVPDTIGFSYGARNNSEILDRMNTLEDGCYILSIELKDGEHAMQFYKNGDEQYLFDPNFGVIDCRHGRHKEQITKLLSSMESIYPPTRDQGPNSEGGAHNITLLKVVQSKTLPDMLAETRKVIIRP